MSAGFLEHIDEVEDLNNQVICRRNMVSATTCVAATDQNQRGRLTRAQLGTVGAE